MTRMLTICGVVAALMLGWYARAEAQWRQSYPTMPPPAQRKSIGNLPPPAAQPSAPATGAYTHRPWAYGKAPYYQQPPVTPYYVVPYYGMAPYYVQPYTYGYPPYRYYPRGYVGPGFYPYFRRF